MARTELVKISKLKLDLKNFRTVPQATEEDAIKAMISVSPDKFAALIDSLITDGYLPTENIIVLETGSKSAKFTVKEGNRRIAALKIIHGIYKATDFAIPDSIKKLIKEITLDWKKANDTVPCSIYAPNEINIVDKIVTLAHGKGEKASRDQWKAVARARHNRDFNKAKEPALDLLEKYLVKGKNITGQQKERWAGDYPLTVLEEAMRKGHTRFGVSTVADMALKYPRINYRMELEEVLRNIGLENIKFETIRSTTNDYLSEDYGLPPLSNSNNSSNSPNTSTDGNNSNTTSSQQNTQNTENSGSSNTSSNTSPSQGTPNSGASGTNSGTKAYSNTDPKSVTKSLKLFTPKGNNRDKVVSLKEEALKLKIKETPLAFCFILRSMFEISAKAYCKDQKITVTGTNGQEKPLVDVLRLVTNHLTKNKTDKSMVKVLHGALTELAKPDGILSVTSMNQLVHSSTFSVIPSDICLLFGNIYPLLEAMN